MSDKIARLGIERDNDLMYYIKDGDVWAVPRKQRGQPKGRPQRIAETDLEMDYSRYIYYLDRDGDVARKERHLGGKPARSKIGKPPKKTGRRPAAKVRGRSPAQLDREIEECLGQAPSPHGQRRRG